jgi:nucleoid-associated protein YgaU
MKKLLLSLIALPLVVSLSAVYADTVSAPSGATAQQQADGVLRADHPETYTVVNGDTLWGISGRFLSKPWLWKELWHMNPKIKNPDLIYPGDTIKLIYINGKPMLTVDRGTASMDKDNSTDCTGGPTEKVEANGVVKMSPKCRATALDAAIPAIPLDSIAAFLSDNIVTSPDQITNAPYIAAGAGTRVVGGAGDSMFARGEFDPNNPTYDILRTGKVYNDPVSHEALGLEMKGIGSGKVLSPNENISAVELIKTREEVIAGDILMHNPELKLSSSFLPQPPEKEVDGYILNVAGGVSQVGQYNIVLISKGERDGLKPGSVLAIYRDGETITDAKTNEKIKLPSQKAGILMVFRAYEKLSYGLVMQADRPLAVGDAVKNP